MELVDLLLLEMEARGLANPSGTAGSWVTPVWRPAASGTPGVRIRRRTDARIRAMTAASRTGADAARYDEGYRAFADASADGCWALELPRPAPVTADVEAQVDLIDHSAVVADANRALARIAGLDRADLLHGLPVRAVLQGDELAVREVIREFVTSGYRMSEREWHDREQDRWFLLSLTGTVRAGALVRVWGLLHDVTERRRLVDRLRQGQKMEAIGQLATGVAHDFNNVLTAILGYVELLHDGLGPGHELVPDVEQIRIAGLRADALTKQLLAFSRKRTLKPEVLDVNEVTRSFEPMLSRLIGENVAIRLDLDPHPWRVRADRGHIEQIIMNLAINARDAMPGGGTLRIGTSRVSVDGGEPARGHVLPVPGPYLCLTLTDTGLGMQAAVQSRIFEPFFTTKDAHGTGLGLATVSGIVEQCDGRIFVESRPDRGTVFTIYFPAIAGDERPAPLAPASPESVSGCETVLVVEDDETVRDLTVRALCRHGYRVLSARRAEEAITVAARFQDRIHVLVTDVMLPGASGASLAESLSRSREGLCVLYSSGYAQSGSEPLVAGSEFVQKPYSARELLQAVRELLDRRAVV